MLAGLQPRAGFLALKRQQRHHPLAPPAPPPAPARLQMLIKLQQAAAAGGGGAGGGVVSRNVLGPDDTKMIELCKTLGVRPGRGGPKWLLQSWAA